MVVSAIASGRAALSNTRFGIARAGAAERVTDRTTFVEMRLAAVRGVVFLQR